MELGFIAWGIGFAVGFGVRFLAGDEAGFRPGICAAIIALAAVMAGKYGAVELTFHMVASTHKVQPEAIVAGMADEIIKDREAHGKPVTWPAGMNVEKATEAKDYPPDVWQEAQTTWDSFDSAEQQKRVAEAQENFNKIFAAVSSTAKSRAFRDSFSGFDILWFLLAVASAFKIGSGSAGSD